MKILISAESDTLDGKVSDRFARAPYFIVVESDNMEFESVQNPFTLDHGMGPKIAKLAIEKSVKAIISAVPGPNAQKILIDSGIELYNGAGRNIKEVLKEYIGRNA